MSFIFENKDENEKRTLEHGVTPTHASASLEHPSLILSSSSESIRSFAEEEGACHELNSVPLLKAGM